jgi:hypothetical protein
MRTVYIYDKTTGKMVQKPTPNEVPEFHISHPSDEFRAFMRDIVDLNAMAVAVPRSKLPHCQEKALTEQQRKENISKVLDMADKEAESFDRRDCVRVQETIERFRHYVLEE